MWIARILGLVASLSFQSTTPPGEQALERLLGRPAVVELPRLDDLGKPLPLPLGWGSLQATADTLTFLKKRFGIERIPTLLYLDRYGNLLYLDGSSNCRQRAHLGAGEFLKKRKELKKQLARLLSAAVEARERGKEAQELASLLNITEFQVAGYAEVESARTRLGEIERDRETRFLQILAAEGLVPTSLLDAQLRELYSVSKGLPVERSIRRERARIKDGIVVEPRKPA